MTVAELERLPDPIGGHYELLHGALLTVACARWDHYLCQERIRAALTAAAGERGLVGTEMPFRPVAEHNLLRADVAFVLWERARPVPRRDYLMGAPDLVVEILSPPSHAGQALPRKKLCLENGCREFWVVHLDARRIEVHEAGGGVRTYEAGQRIAVSMFDGGEIALSEIFS